jgi:hypothetical protein
MLHVVQKQVFDLRLRNSRADSLVLDQMSSLCREVVNPVIENVLDRYGSGDEYLFVDRLELDLGDFSSAELNSQLGEKVEQFFATRLEQLIASVPSTKTTTADAVEIEQLSAEAVEWLLLGSYLGSGVLPYWAAHHSLTDIHGLMQKFIRERPVQLRQLLQQLPDENTARRLAMQFEMPFNGQLIGLLLGQTPAWGELLGRVLTVMARSGHQLHSESPALSVMASLLRHALLAKGDADLDKFYERIADAYAGDSAAGDDSVDQEQVQEIKALHTKLLMMVPPPSDDAIYRALCERQILPSSDLSRSETLQSGEDTTARKVKQRVGDSPAVHDLSQQSDRSTNGKDAQLEMAPPGVKQQAAVTAPLDESEVPAEADVFHSGDAPNVVASPSQPLPAVTPISAAGAEQPVLMQSSQTAATELEATRANGLACAETFYIQNAGLVLLWQYLPHYFQALSLLHDGSFIDGEAQTRAVLALQFLASFEEEFSEPDMSLSKILCGLNVAEPVPLCYLPDKQEQAEAEALLQSLITHWSVLGSISVVGLQESFLRREGRLQRSDVGWQMLVERRAYDMLLDKLPWGIGLVRLKWMQQAVSVEW